MTDENKFYFDGKSFDNFEELQAFIGKWFQMPLEEETAARKIDQFKKQLILNVFTTGVSITNEQFTRFVKNIFDFSIQELHKISAE